MKSRQRSVTMAGSVLDPQTPMEDSEDKDSSTVEENTIRQGSRRNLLKDRKSEGESSRKSLDVGRPLTSGSNSQKSAVAAENEDTKATRPVVEEGITAREDDINNSSDPPKTSDVEKGNVSNTSLPLVHQGHPSSTKARKSKDESKAVNESSSSEDSPDDDPSGMSTRAKVMIYFCFCLAIVFILQGIIIGMVVDDKDGDKKAAQSPVPPTGSPSSADPPTNIQQSPLVSFQSIASAPGAFLIDKLSTCDDCTTTIIYPSSDDNNNNPNNDRLLLQWNSVASIHEVVIDTNGFFVLNCQEYGVCGRIDLTGSLDLAPNVDGNIYALWGKEPRRIINLDDHPSKKEGRQQASDSNNSLIPTLTISWEDVNLFGYDFTREFRINAQVKVSEQEIVFCYGEGNVNGAMFRSGILNYTNGNEYTPVNNITGFDRDGYSMTFPENVCETMILG